jgi:hypothetical protein
MCLKSSVFVLSTVCLSIVLLTGNLAAKFSEKQLESVDEIISVYIADPWQKQMPLDKTGHLLLDVKLNLSPKQLQNRLLKVKLNSRRKGNETVALQFNNLKPNMTIPVDTHQIQWGAYDVVVTILDIKSKELASKNCVATVLPGGKEKIRVLNSLVSELMNAKLRGLLDRVRIEFMNPRDGWVWFRAAGACKLSLNEKKNEILTVKAQEPDEEVMLHLPMGRHTIMIDGSLSELVVHAIPALIYNVFPSETQIKPFGSHTWERLSKQMLPNVNMIEAQVSETPESVSWLAQGKSWLANVQAPGMLDKKEWSVEKMIDRWLNPRGFDLSKLSGMQVDEYWATASPDNLLKTTKSLVRLAEDPKFFGKMWIPFVIRMYGNEKAEGLMKIVRDAGWPYSLEVYVGEMKTEAENLKNIRNRFFKVAEMYEKAYPDAMKKAIFTLMYSYLPYCTSNRHPEADFRVHLDMQMNLLASHPAFFGLWGVQPYRSNYVNKEILNYMAKLLRHYCIAGNTDRFIEDPYELKHIADPDFTKGTLEWQVVQAKNGNVRAGQFLDYGTLQGRYPKCSYGDTFLILKRDATQPNIVSQNVKGLEKGRHYSLKIYTGDYQDLIAGRSKKRITRLSLNIHGAEVLPGAFAWPFRSNRGGASSYTKDKPFWMTYHWLMFRAIGPSAKLVIHDWENENSFGGPVGQETMVNFVELQPVHIEKQAYLQK